MSELVKPVSSVEFEEEVVNLSKQVPVLVDFWADWCEPCKQLMPILHDLVESLSGAIRLATINTDQEQELAMQLGIRSLPTVVLFKNGEIVEQFSGVKPESEIRQLLQQYISKNQQEQVIASDEMQNAITAINQGQIEQAIGFLKNDNSLNAQLLLIKLYLQEGNVDNAIATFEQLDDEQKQESQSLIIKTTLELISCGNITKNIPLQQAIEETITIDPQQGIEHLLQLLSTAQTQDKDEIKKSLIIAFKLIDDVKLVSQLRRKMAALIF